MIKITVHLWVNDSLESREKPLTVYFCFLLFYQRCFQAGWNILYKLFNVFWICPRGVLPVRCASNGRCQRGILVRCLNHLSWLISIWGSSTLNSSTPSSLHMSELGALSPNTQQRVTTQSCDRRWRSERRLTGKLRAFPSGSALTSWQRFGTMSLLLLTLHQHARGAHAPFYPHSWTRP